jgi:uncharacterized membrane protein YkoI
MKIRVAILVSGLLVAGATFAQEQVKVVALADVPAPVQKAIQAQLKGATITEIDLIEENGEVSYDVAVSTKDGQSGGFTLGADGKMQRLEIALADAPAVVQKAIKAQLGADTLVSIEKTLDDEGLTYDVSAVMKNGQDRDFSISPDGKLDSMQVFLADTPAAVQKTINAKLQKGKVDNIEESFDDDGNIYAVEMTAKNGDERHFSVGADGKLESLQMTLTETPAVVQAAIKTQLGDGKLNDIEENFAEGGITFEVEMSAKNGTNLDFSVNSGGKLETLQMVFADTPAEVQETIRAQLGMNKPDRIEEDFADEGNSYEVEMKAPDGSNRDLTVGSDGKLETLQMSLTETPLEIQTAIRTQLGQNKLDRIEKDFDDISPTYEIEMKTKDGSTRSFTLEEDGKLESLELSLAETPAEVQKTINGQIAGGKLESVEKIFEDDGISYDVAVTTKAGKVKSFSVAANGTLEK